MLFACCGVAISVGEASEQLLLDDGVVGVLSTTREIGDSIGINDGDVVGAAGECDDERAAVGGAVVISNGVVDGDVLGVTSSEALVGGISWVKGPGAVGVDGQARDVSTKEAVGDGVFGVGIS